jgi:16S rRNA (cytosine1402-N4)-methyltransferase
MHQNKNKNHIPVLLEEVITTLSPKLNESYLDLTAGYAGHAAAILAITKNPSGSVLVDRDVTAISYLQKKFLDTGVNIIDQDFLTASKNLKDLKYKFDLILADLGVSSLHIDEAQRGFSIKNNGPLDMRMDQRQLLTAQKVVNEYPREDLIRILKEYGEEPKAKLIVDKIINNRPLTSTEELAKLIEPVWSRSTIHPATRTFQALRIEVNKELSLLSESMNVWLDLLEIGGRIGIISFHSLEDRIIKNFFKEQSQSGYESSLKILTKKPLRASPTEIAHNPRSRSAKLRVAVKIKK